MLTAQDPFIANFTDYGIMGLGIDEVRKGFQRLIDDGSVWTLGDRFVRLADILITLKFCKATTQPE